MTKEEHNDPAACEQLRWSLHLSTLPWGNRPSIYQHIIKCIHSNENGQIPMDDILPDEELVRGDSGIGFAAGALDGMLLHSDALGFVDTNTVMEDPSDSQYEEPHDHRMLSALQQLIIEPSKESAAEFYSLLLQHGAITYLNPLIEAIRYSTHLPLARIVEVGRWLAVEAADREAVKVGMALLSLGQSSAYREIFLTLGRHEEFSLYAAVSLQHTETEPERFIWELAKKLDGWGRVALVEQLASTHDPEIKRWMLTRGFKNSVENDEVALVCITAGDLYTALLTPNPDQELLEGAGNILNRLMWPAYNSGMLTQYTDAVAATLLYLRHMQTCELNIDAFFSIYYIRKFVSNDHVADINRKETGRWNEHTEEILSLISDIFTRPAWKQPVLEGLASTDGRTHNRTVEMAKILGLDILISETDTSVERRL